MGVTAPEIRWAERADIPAMIPLMRALYAHDVPDAPLPDDDAMIAAHLDDLLAPDTPHRPAVAFDADGAARARQACRLDWHVKRNNARGIAFYERFGGAVVTQRLSMRKALQRQ